MNCPKTSKESKWKELCKLAEAALKNWVNLWQIYFEWNYSVNLTQGTWITRKSDRQWKMLNCVARNATTALKNCNLHEKVLTVIVRCALVRLVSSYLRGSFATVPWCQSWLKKFMWAGFCQVAKVSCVSLPLVQQLSPTLSALAHSPGQAGQNRACCVSARRWHWCSFQPGCCTSASTNS